MTSSLAVDSFGGVGVAYYDASHGDLKYGYFDGSDWSVTTLDAKGNVGLNPSLAFNSWGDPLIQGIYTNNTDVPFERTAALGDKAFFTEEEIKTRRKAAARDAAR